MVALHLAVLIALLNLSGKSDIRSAQTALGIILIRQELPKRHLEPRRETIRLRPNRGSTSPKTIPREAAQEIMPRAPTLLPKAEQIDAGQTVGAGASTGAGQAAGAGGAGQGSGNGTGGSGSGGEGGAIEPPRLATPVMSGGDFSRDQLRQWPRGVTIFLRLRIDPQGHVAECMIDRGTGIFAIDGAICNLAHDRLLFRPAVGRSGQKVAGWFGYAQPAPR